MNRFNYFFKNSTFKLLKTKENNAKTREKFKLLVHKDFYKPYFVSNYIINDFCNFSSIYENIPNIKSLEKFFDKRKGFDYKEGYFYYFGPETKYLLKEQVKDLIETLGKISKLVVFS